MFIWCKILNLITLISAPIFPYKSKYLTPALIFPIEIRFNYSSSSFCPFTCHFDHRCEVWIVNQGFWENFQILQIPWKYSHLEF